MGTPQQPDTGVYISNGQTYQEVRDLARTVDRIEHKLDEIVTATKDIRNDVADHETRLRNLEAMPKGDAIDVRLTTLERAKWPLPTVGVLAGVGGAVTGALALFMK